MTDCTGQCMLVTKGFIIYRVLLYDENVDTELNNKSLVWAVSIMFQTTCVFNRKGAPPIRRHFIVLS